MTMADPVPETDHVSSFRDAMKAEGIEYTGTIETDGSFHRFRVEGDKSGRNGWYVLHIDDHPAGAFGCMKRYGAERRFTWTAVGVAPLTPQERARLTAESAKRKAESERAKVEIQARAAERSRAMWEAAKPVDDHPYLRAKGVKGYGLRAGTFLREIRPNDDGSRRPDHATAGALLIPMRSKASKETVGLQAIFSPAVRWGGDLRSKDFVYGALKRGCWFSIGKAIPGHDGRPVALIVEGYATGATVHEMTGHGVIVAFDAGNLLPVAQAVRELMPRARIIICADNDQWTTTPIANPGVTHATAAAAAVAGEVLSPWFSRLETQPTDWNDLAMIEGATVARSQLMAMIEPRREPEPDLEPEPDDIPPPADEGGEPDVEGAKKKREKKPPPEPPADDQISNDSYFRFLGHDRDQIYLFQREKRMVVSRRDSDWSDNAFLTLAPLAWWERTFPGSAVERRKMAANWLIRKSYQIGFYNPNLVRGRGAARDAGRIVFHLGDRLLVDNEFMALTEIESDFVYEQGPRMDSPADDVLSQKDGRRIIEMAQKFSFTRPASAILLAGWVALSRVCGALNWRPHIWLTGGTGSGKTTVLEFFINDLAKIEMFAAGNSSEPGVRGSLGIDAIPVLVDEVEQNNEQQRVRVQAILEMIRQSSTQSGARTMKGAAGGNKTVSFRTRSMFCLSSVQVGMEHQADQERVTVLALKPKRETPNAAAAWLEIKKSLNDLAADRELASRLFRRSVALLPTTLINIDTFSRAAAERFGSQREGDQYGTLIAGAWSLVSSKPATLEQAREMIDRYDWTEYLETTETDESTKALQTLLGKLVRGHRGTDVSIYEVVCAAAGLPRETYAPGKEEAAGLLQRHGMKILWEGASVEAAFLLMANGSHELQRLMAGTPYVADLRGQLLRVPGASRHNAERFNGTLARSVSVPLVSILTDQRPAPDLEPVDDDIQF